MTKNENDLTPQQRENCRILAEEILPEVPDKLFDMSTFGNTENVRECGTVGCALGWAAMSGRIDGLQYGAWNIFDGTWAKSLRGITRRHVIEPLVGGQAVGWPCAGHDFFGELTYRRIFTGFGVNYSKAQVIERLLKLSRGEVVV